MKIFALLCFFGLLVSSLYAGVGTIVFTKGDVFLLRGNQQTPAIVGSKLQEKDTITTKAASLVKLLLEDKSAISIGANSDFSIEKYLFGEKKNSQAKFKMNKGVFRMITGKIAKIRPDKFKLKTRTVTIGIRGTIFSGTIKKAKEEIFCEHGEIYVSSQGVTEDVKKGYKTSVTPGKAPSKAKPYFAIELDEIHGQVSSWKDKKCTEAF